MKERVVVAVAAALIAVAGRPPAVVAQGVQACPDVNDCVEVTIGDASGSPGETVTVGLTFKQAADDAQVGGPDEIAAVALTLDIPGTGTGTPLTLADCTLDAEGLPGAVKPDASISNFKVVVENASCDNGRTHCLCPEAGSGITPDDFVNLVIYGPNPLPTPGPSPIDIPVLPVGPQELLTIDFAIEAGASGTIPLHVLNEVTDTQRPQFRAFLSVGDKEAVDQTCVPVPGSPPCTGGGGGSQGGGSVAQDGAVSQVAITDGSVMVSAACVGDCNGNAEVTVDELLTMVNIALENTPVLTCEAGDANGNGAITVDEILTGVNNVLSGCQLG